MSLCIHYVPVFSEKMRGLVMSLCTCIFRKDERPKKKLHVEGTDIHTNTQTHGQTSQLLERIGLMGRFFENF